MAPISGSQWECMLRRYVLGMAAMAAALSLSAVALFSVAPFAVAADSTVKVGFPMALSGPAALYGQPVLQGAQMYVAKRTPRGQAYSAGRSTPPRDTKANADEAVRVSRELILKDNVDFLVGPMTSAESLAVRPSPRRTRSSSSRRWRRRSN